MNAGEWIRLTHEWEAAQVALTSLQEDIYSEVLLYFKGEGLGPTAVMIDTLHSMREEVDEITAELDKVLADVLAQRKQ